jgi:hypothetical protein
MTATAPATSAWDHGLIVDQAMAVLRLDADDRDADRIATAADEATDLIDAFLDLEVGMTTIPVVAQGAAVQVTIELYRRKDAPFGVTDAWSPDGVPVQLSSDPLQGVKKRLRSLKGRCGVG